MNAVDYIYWLLAICGFFGYALLVLVYPFVAFVILMFLALTTWPSTIKVTPGISLMVGVGLVFTTAYLVRLLLLGAQGRVSGQGTVKLKKYGCFFGLIAVAFISTLFNLDGPAGLVPTFTYLQLFLLFVLVVNLATTHSRLHALSMVLVAASALLAILILLDQFHLLPPGLLPQHTSNVLVYEGYTSVTRAAGWWGGDPNMTAVQLTVALPFLIEWWPAMRGVGQRVLLFSIAAAITAALLFTFSVSGMIGLLMIVLTREITSMRRDTVMKVLRITCGGILAVVILSVALPDLYKQRFLAEFDVLVESVSTLNTYQVLKIATNRGDAWQATVYAIADAPLLGHGAGNAQFANARYSILYPGRLLAPHNMFLEIGSEFGLPGLVLFAQLLISKTLAVRRAYRKKPKRSIAQQTGRAIFIALVAYMVQGLALDIQTLKLLWVLLGMAVAYKQLSFPHTVTTPEEKTDPDPDQTGKGGQV